MNFNFKLPDFPIMLILTLFAFLLCAAAYEVIITDYYLHAPFTSIIGFVVIIIAGYYFFKNYKNICVIFFVLVAFGLQSCHYAKSNQQVLISNDCGSTWTKIEAGQSVPKGAFDPCYMKVVIPNYPMQGESKFICNLEGKVRAVVHIDYDYSITNPLAFIKQAKYLGKANTHADSEEALDNDAFEGAENMVIDTRIRDVAKGIFINEDIVELDQANLENLLSIECNKVLEPFGVFLNFITLTFDLDEQTRQAIDVATATKIYESKNIKELGEKIMIQKAGASKITINTSNNNSESENK